jgi:alkane 1-monooxygenase
VHLPVPADPVRGLVFACWLWSSGHLSTLDSVGLALTMAMVSGIAINTAHELGHKRASSRALAQPRRARPERLRALLHRAQPRPPRARRHPRGSGQLAPGRELLRVLPRTVRQPALELGARARAPAPPGARAWSPAQRHPRRLGDDRRAVRGARRRVRAVVLPYLLIQAVVGFSLLEVVNYLEHYGLLRQKREDGRYERTPRAQLEQQQRRLERAALPPAAPLRPPRQPDPPLPGAAPLRRGAAAAHRLRRHDRARVHPAAVAARDGPPRARPLPRPRTSTAPQPQAGPAAGAPHARRAHDEPLSLPTCGYVYDEQHGHPREGFPPGTPWSEVPDDWACPDCGVRDKVDFEPVE